MELKIASQLMTFTEDLNGRPITVLLDVDYQHGRFNIIPAFGCRSFSFINQDEGSFAPVVGELIRQAGEEGARLLESHKWRK